MKKILKYVVLFIAILSSCEQLELVPISQKSVEGFYKSDSHLNQAVMGAYNGLRSSWITSQSSYMLTEARSDNAFQGQAYDDGPITRFEVRPDLPVLASTWSSYYNYINRCNRILESLENVELIDSKRNQYEGEARFARALFYFDLVRLWGGVPIVTTSLSIEESYNKLRSSQEEVYDLIVSDLLAASDLLPSNYPDMDRGRATQFAAKGYLGKVYLFRSGYPLLKNEWELAKQAFSEVIDSGQFSFFESYGDIYSYEHEGGKQQVFSIKFLAGTSGNGNPFPTRNASNDIAPFSIEEGGLPFGGSPFNLFLSDDFLDSFEPGDRRKDVAIQSSWLHKSGDIITTLPTSKKYRNGPVVGPNDWDIDWIALSYTDILMMYAECLNEIAYQSGGEAFTILNKVRERAGLNPKTAEEVSDQESFRQWMENERRLEFCFENIRWFDLVRTDRAFVVMKEFLKPYGLDNNLRSKEQYMYPIPQSVRDISPDISQNPGY